MTNIFDYIVCGGGTAGSVVAGRLSENPAISVLLLEAGEHSKDMENVHMVGGWSNNFDTPADWNIVTQPNKGMNDRQVKASRGRLLGGCSGLNGTLCVRGTKQDFDDWQLPGWSGDDMWRCMQKAETFHPKDWFKAEENLHGTDGLLHTEPMDPAPITGLIGESMQDKGLSLHPDMFTTGDVPTGCGYAVRSVWKGIRTTGADFLQERPNLTVLTQRTVDKVILADEGGEIRATGVATVGEDDTVEVFSAKREVIISGGSYCTPPILMRSGIGDKKELESHGIECKVNLPGVGKNLQDHLIVFSFYEVSKPGLTTDHLLYHRDGLSESYRQWKEEKTGALVHFPFGMFAYSRLDERLADSEIWKNAPTKPGRDPMGLTPSQPNIEFFTTECYGGPKQFDQFPVENKYVFAMISELFSPHSRGTVKLASTDPKSNPIVDHDYFSDPLGLDLEVLAEACAFGNEIVMEGAGTKKIVAGSWPTNLTHHTNKGRDSWKEYVKEQASTCYHPGGTAKMGSADDSMAVLDERLNVRGVKGLRVADCSVMPKLNQGHTQMPAYGIGEKAAELILEDLKL